MTIDKAQQSARFALKMRQEMPGQDGFLAITKVAALRWLILVKFSCQSRGPEAGDDLVSMPLGFVPAPARNGAQYLHLGDLAPPGLPAVTPVVAPNSCYRHSDTGISSRTEEIPLRADNEKMSANVCGPDYADKPTLNRLPIIVAFVPSLLLWVLIWIAVWRLIWL